MRTRILLAAAAAALLAACTSQEPTARDAEGHYATTSDYSEMNRTELVSAMDAGLVDVDRRRLELEQRAEVLGQDAIDELHDREAELAEARTKFVNELARLRASLDADWKARGEDTVEAFEDLRGELDNAYEEVLEEA
jgi:type IV pilus biogenesis protein CpaD/CtpE